MWIAVWDNYLNYISRILKKTIYYIKNIYFVPGIKKY